MKVYSIPREGTSPKFAKVFAAGAGCAVSESNYEGGPWAGFGSPVNWHEMQAAIASGQNWYYGDHAYFKRKIYYRITKNALFSHGIGQSNKQRIRQLYLKAMPWNRLGRKIIVCPQSDTLFRLRCNTTQADWLAMVARELKKYTDREFVIHLKNEQKPLLSMFDNAYCVISHSSNSAVESLMAGVPAITLADCPARHMTRNSIADIENLLYPDGRYEWAAVLADNQWTFPEIENGMAWRHLNEKV